MVDFIEAFKQGQIVAERVKNNHQEIDFVFERLNEQLAQATEGKIQLSIEEIEDFSQQPYVVDDSEPVWPIDYLAICAEHKELAEWEKGIEGYPCKITIGNKQHYCEDRTELENALALMLQDPIIAQTLADVMRLSEKNN